MQSLHDIKKRIKSVRETGKITKAMQLISVAKMRKANEKYELNARYFERVLSTLKDIITHTEDLTHPYIVSRGDKRAAFLVIASDNGMAGDYNRRVLEFALEKIESEKPVKIYTIGLMAREFFARHGIRTDAQFLYCAQDPSLSDARRIMMYLVEAFDEGEIDCVKIIYTRHLPEGDVAVSLKALPPDPKELENVELESNYTEMLEFEPSTAEVFDILVPQCILGIIYSTLIQSVRCEHNERMAAMRQASDNAEEMLGKLELDFHRARQAAITTEIAEISSARTD